MSASRSEYNYIRVFYGIDIYKGCRLKYTNTKGETRYGAVCGVRNQYIKIHFDGDKKPHQGVFHPTSDIVYI